METEGTSRGILQRDIANNVSDEIQLNQEEALNLANHLKEKREAGLLVDSDPESIAAMVAGLGDPRGLLRRRFSESLGSVGKPAVPALCRAMRFSSQVTVRRASAKTLILSIFRLDLVNCFFLVKYCSLCVLKVHIYLFF